MGELVGNDGSAEISQALAIGNRFQCAIIYGPNQLGADEHVYIQLQSGEPPYATKNPIRPVGFLQRHPMILYESPQERCMTLLLSDEQLKYPEWE